MSSNRCFMLGISVRLMGWWARGVYPMSSSNGVFFVVADSHEFFVYCARGSQACQLFCCVLQKSHKYYSRDWLVRLLAPSV